MLTSWSEQSTPAELSNASVFIRPPAKSLSLSAEGVALNGQPSPVAFVFGPENGAISEKLVHAALQEAQGCPKPALIRVETQASHGYRPTDKRIAELADEWAFADANMRR